MRKKYDGMSRVLRTKKYVVDVFMSKTTF